VWIASSTPVVILSVAVIASLCALHYAVTTVSVRACGWSPHCVDNFASPSLFLATPTIASVSISRVPIITFLRQSLSPFAIGNFPVSTGVVALLLRGVAELVAEPSSRHLARRGASLPGLAVHVFPEVALLSIVPARIAALAVF
jgi:hypothetical protein